MYPWKLVGCEEWTNENGEECVRLYCEHALVLEDGHSGTGTETQRFFFKRKYVKYDPVIGHMIAVLVNDRGYVQQVIVVGQV